MEKSLSIVDISEKPWEQRWGTAEEILKENGWSVTVRYAQSNPGDLKKHYDDLSKNPPDVCVIGESLAVEMRNHLTHTTQESDLLGAVLLLMKKICQNKFDRKLLEKF